MVVCITDKGIMASMTAKQLLAAFCNKTGEGVITPDNKTIIFHIDPQNRIEFRFNDTGNLIEYEVFNDD